MPGLHYAQFLVRYGKNWYPYHFFGSWTNYLAKPRLHYPQFSVPYHFLVLGLPKWTTQKSHTGTNFIRAAPKIERSVNGALDTIIYIRLCKKLLEIYPLVNHFNA